MKSYNLSEKEVESEVVNFAIDQLKEVGIIINKNIIERIDVKREH